MERTIRIYGAALLTALLLRTTVQSQNRNFSVEEYPSPLIRERQLITVANTTEVWELRWKALPKPACEPSDVSLVCPCIGFAYGEGGDLILVRIRDGQEDDRLELTDSFKGR